MSRGRTIRRNASRFGWLLWAVCSAAQTAKSGQELPINLLRLPNAKLETASIAAGERRSLAALVDGDPDSASVAAASNSSPLIVVFGFGGATIAPEALVVHLPGRAPDGAAAERVEILVSELSANAGFRSLRVDPLKYGEKPDKFEFPPTGAGWIMLRFTPVEGATQVAIGEVEVLGREGPPATRYEFKQSPAKALNVLSKLKQASLDARITSDEAALFADAADGKLDTWSFAEAALLASGVLEKPRRDQYLRRLEAIERDARRAVTGVKRPFDQGEKLLAMLHKGPLAKGYAAHQTDLSVILDTGQYNCVSSAALYNVIGRRLGLDLRAIEVPDHAFAVLYDGAEHADVETTTDQGFNPIRDEAAQKKFERQTGFRYIPDSHRDQRREINEAGLVAIIYYNHGVELTREKKYPAALATYFRALSLDSQFDSAVKNALAALANWSLELAQQEKFEESLSVVQTGLDLAPEDGTLVHNHKVIWGQWADATMASGHVDEALTILRRAAEKLPDEAEDFRDREAWLFIRRGEELAKGEKWQESMAAVEPGLDKLSGKPREELIQWRNGIYLRWADKELDEKRFEKAIEVLDQGMQTVQDERLANNLAYTVQQWAKEVYEKQGEEAAKTTIVGLLKRYPKLPSVKEVAENHFRRVVLELRDAGKFDEALAAVDRYKDLLERLGKSDEAQELAASVYDSSARNHMQAKEWAEALAVYEKGRGRLPDADLLQTNLVFCCQEWLKASLEKSGEAETQKLAIALLKQYPREKDVRDVATNHFRRVVQGLRDQEKFAEAIAAVDRHKDLLSALEDNEAADDALEAVYDRWARKFFKKDWPKAIEIYQQGLKRVPKSGLLQNNLKFCEQEAKK